jgi:hypothetical protein
MSGYTPALQVIEQTKISKLRELPLPGKNLVTVGQSVSANDEVLTAELPGELSIVRTAERLGFEPEEIPAGLLVKVGDEVTKGQVVVRLKTFFGLFTSELKSTVSGKVEFFVEANAHLGIRLASKPLSVKAYINGEVSEVESGKSVTIVSDGALIQGIFGVGGERFGEILALDLPNDKIVTPKDLEQYELTGKVLIGGASFSDEAIAYVKSHQASAVVTGSISAETLRQFVGYEIGVSITGDEDVPFSLIITEGFGRLAISPRVMDLATKLNGKFASVNGATQVRAGALRPEVIVSSSGASKNTASDHAALYSLDVGKRVRIIRVPYFGEFATVSELPHAPEQIPSGAKVRVLKAKLDNGKEVTVPRANVELV